MSNLDKLYECWKLLYSMSDEELNSAIADKIREEADIYFYQLTQEELELHKEKVRKTAEQIDFLNKLEELVVKYDKQEGRYQESEFEGYEFYAFVCEEFNQDFDPRDKLTKEYPELYDKQDNY
jgi:hypothetical protein